MNLSKHFHLLAMLSVTGILAGCASSGVHNPSGTGVTEMRPDETGFVAGTGIESQDIVRATDKMARGIMQIPQIVGAQNAPCIVLDPVINNTSFTINKDMFLQRIETGLIRQAAGKVTFLERERMKTLEHERDLKRAGQVTASADPNAVEFKGADFFLTGTLSSLTTRTSAGRSDYVMCTFKLLDARTSAIVWQDDYEMKKQGLEDAAYR